MAGTKVAKIASSILTGVSALYGASALYKYSGFLDFGNSGVHSFSSVLTHSEIALFFAGTSALVYWRYVRRNHKPPAREEYKELPKL